MNKEEIDYGLAIEGLQKTDDLRELAKIQLNKMVENSKKQYIKSLQQENKQLKEQLNMLYPLFNTTFKGKKLKFLSIEKCNNKCCFNYKLEEENKI